MPVMRRLEMNFQQPPERPRKTAGWILLLTGLALLIEVGVSYDSAQRDRTRMSNMAVASKFDFEIPDREAKNPRYADKDFAEAQQIIARLSTPWNEFFAGLEPKKPENVAILVIEPDVKSRLLTLQGEAKDYVAVLNFIAQLRETKPFSKVFLLHHEIKPDDPQHPVAFTLSLHWVKPS
jgi:hypothetical protein